MFRYVFFLYAIFCFISGFLVLSIVFEKILNELDINNNYSKIKMIKNLEEQDNNNNSDDYSSVDLLIGNGEEISGNRNNNNNSNNYSNDKNNIHDTNGDNSVNNLDENNDNNNRIIQSICDLFIKNNSLKLFCIVVFLSGFGSGVIDAFLFLRLKQLGGSGIVMGISRFITCAGCNILLLLY